MNNDDVNDRKQKLSNIIKKITDSQLLKLRDADNNACSRQDCKFPMNPQERDNEMNKAMSIKLLNEKGHFGTPAGVGGYNPDVAGPSTELPTSLVKPVGPRITM